MPDTTNGETDVAQADEVPTPGGVALLGNGYKFAQDPVGAIEEFASHGDIVRFSFPGQSMYMVTGPSMIEEILVTKHQQFSIGPAQTESFSGIADDAVTMSTGEKWQRLRRAIQPAFSGDTVESYRDRMRHEAAETVARWTDGEKIDLLEETRRLTLRILADTMLGIDIRGRESVVMDASDALISRANFRRPGRFLPDWFPTSTDRRFERAVQRLDDFVADCLADCEPDPDGADVSSVLLAARERGALSRSEVRHNLVAMLLAGNSSPAVTLTHAWRLLDENPDIHERVLTEIETVTNGEYFAACVDDLELTGNVLSETLRLFPPTTGVSRQATEPVTVGGHEFESGTQFLLPQWAPHRDERFWDDPERFDPHRWERSSDRPEYAYFPFSGGPRFCPGMHFARQEMILTLATMVQQVDLAVEIEGELTFTPSMTLRPATDITATVRRRGRYR